MDSARLRTYLSQSHFVCAFHFERSRLSYIEFLGLSGAFNLERPTNLFFFVSPGTLLPYTHKVFYIKGLYAFWIFAPSLTLCNYLTEYSEPSSNYSILRDRDNLNHSFKISNYGFCASFTDLCALVPASAL